MLNKNNVIASKAWQSINKNNSFIGCESEFSASKTVVFGAPFDGTATYRTGARFAYKRMREESYGIETFSPYLNKDLLDVAVHDAGELDLCFGNTQKALLQIEEFVAFLLNENKTPCMVGGEHLVTLPAVKTVLKKYPNLCVVHFDAHADLRDNYLGEKLSHSSVMRRVHELVGDDRIFQFGIRSGEREEFEFAKKHTSLTLNNFYNLQEAVKKIGARPVYFTIDMDVLDPSEFPATGTPEAGGVRFLQLLDAINAVFKLNVVACDINELCPPLDPSGISTALACKLLREILLSIHNS
jgi:agmatinase